MFSHASSETLNVEQFLAEHERKQLVRFVVVGSVDDGKSSFIGRMLYETNSLYEDQIAQVKKASKQGGVEIDFSLFTDGLKAEREQAITIDVAYRYFSTQGRKYIIADTPGHVQYTRNMVTGASTADVAIIMIDARMGLLPQSRRHAYLASLLGIPWLAVAVNKMDLVDYDQATFEKLRGEFETYAQKLGFEGVRFFPISALAGDNVVASSPKTPWYRGGSVLDFLESVPVAEGRGLGPFRFPIQYVLRPHLDYRAFAGQVASGTLKAGDEVQLLPSGVRTRVKAIDTFEGAQPHVAAPLSVALRLEDEVDLSRGDMLVRPGFAPATRHELTAMLVWLSETPLDTGRPYLLKHTTRTVPAEVASLSHRLDLETLTPAPVPSLSLNEIAQVTLRLRRPIFADAYRENRATGAFILIDALSNNTVAAGMVLPSEDTTESWAEGSSATKQVSADERRERLGHGAAIVVLDLASDTAARALAGVIERRLFDQQVLSATVVDQYDLAVAMADAGLVCLFVPPSDPTAKDRARAKLRLSTHKLVELSADRLAPAEHAMAELRRAGAIR